jgi:cytochrome P450
MLLERGLPPGPSMFTAMRNLRSLTSGGDLSSIPPYLASLSAQYGPIAAWPMGRRRFFFLDDAALIEEALVTKARDYMKGRGIQRLKPLLGNGLLTSEQPLHLRQRRMMQPAFHKDRVAGYGARMVALTQTHIAQWQDGDELAIDAEMTRLTLGIAAETLFSANVDAQAAIVRDALRDVLEAFPASMSLFGELLNHFAFLPVTRRSRAARAKLDGVIYGIIEQRRRSNETHDDLLDMLLTARDDADGGMDDEQVRDEAMTIFLAGHETTANALAWTWCLLAQHPDVEARLATEIDAVLGDGRPATAADLPRLPYTRDIFAEAMRLYPPAWALGRRALTDSSLGEWSIPSGSIVIASQLVTHRNPRYWTDPEAFRPERWAAEAADLPRFAYFPFGGGNRRCIGESFAWMEGVLVLATIAQTWRFRLTGGVPAVQPLVTLRPRNPIHVAAQRVGAHSS